MKVQYIGPKMAAIATFVALSLAVFVLLLRMAGVEMGFGHHYKLTARFPDGLQLVKNADVRTKGMKVGRVTDIRAHGSEAEVVMQLDDKVLPVYRDASVQLRTKTLVGENYVELVPGTPAAGRLPSGSRLPVTRAKEAVQLDDILSALDPATRRHVQRTIRGMAGGFAGHGADANAAFAALQPTFGDGGSVMAILDARRAQLASLIGDAGDVMQAFGERTADVRTLATKLRAAAAAAAGRDAEIRATLRSLPPALRQAKESSGRLASLSQTATPVAENLAAASTDLSPAVRDLRPAAHAATVMVDQLHALLPDARPLLDNLKTFAGKARPLAPALDAVLRQVNPALAYLAPYHREFGAFFANVGSVVDTHDALGNLGRVHAVVSETSAAVWTPAMQKALNALIDTGGVEKIHREYVNAYPKPGTVGRPEQASGGYPRITADPRP